MSFQRLYELVRCLGALSLTTRVSPTRVLPNKMAPTNFKRLDVGEKKDDRSSDSNSAQIFGVLPAFFQIVIKILWLDASGHLGSDKANDFIREVLKIFVRFARIAWSRYPKLFYLICDIRLKLKPSQKFDYARNDLRIRVIRVGDWYKRRG